MELDEFDSELSNDETKEESVATELNFDGSEELNDFTISDELIDEMKAMGMKKPDEVSWGRWVGPRDHSHRHDLLVHLAATGLTNNQIAEELCMSVSRVCIILQQQSIKQKIRDKQGELFANDARKRIESLAHKSIDVLEEQITSKQESSKVRQSAATYLLDQSIGKSKQEIHHSGSILNEFLARVEQLPLKDVTPQKSLDSSSDPIDAFIEENVPDSVKVGQRG